MKSGKIGFSSAYPSAQFAADCGSLSTNWTTLSNECINPDLNFSNIRNLKSRYCDCTADVMLTSSKSSKKCWYLPTRVAILVSPKLKEVTFDRAAFIFFTFIHFAYKIQTRLWLRSIWICTKFLSTYAGPSTKSCSSSMLGCLSKLTIIKPLHTCKWTSSIRTAPKTLYTCMASAWWHE